MAKKIPKFSYTGQCSTGSDDTYWYIFLTTSGTLTFEYAKAGVDVGCVGGGGSSACVRQAGNPAGGSGGGGGYLASGKAAIEAKKGYAVTIGAGGAVPAAWEAGNDGGTTSALGVSAAGGPGGGYEGTQGGEAAAGGSGIVILRGTQDDLLPVFFNGVQLSEIWLNGVKATGLIRDGVRVFTRRMKACFA